MKTSLLWSSLFYCLVLGLCSCSNNSDSDNKSTFLCTTAADCDGLTGSEGNICLDAQCASCSADWQCSQVPHYGTGARCVTGRCSVDQLTATQHENCIAGIESCACLVDDSCKRPLVCDDVLKTCRKPKTCADIQCQDKGACIPASDSKDAICVGDCKNGLVWSATAQACIRQGSNCLADDPKSMVLECAQQGRVCTIVDEGASCGTCLDDFTAQDNACIALARCADLNCAATHQLCVDEPNGHCDKCMPGYVKDSSSNRCIATCDALQCATDEKCVEHINDTQAICVKTLGPNYPQIPSCLENEAYNPMWQACQDCGNLNCIEDDRHTGHIYPIVNNQFRCICETKPGFYYDNATMQAEPCDADGDGWLRRSAWDALSRRTDCSILGDPNCDWALHDNARCKVNTIDRIVLENIYGESDTIFLSSDDLTKYTVPSGLLELYETDANDDFSLRAARDALPLYANRDADKASSRAFNAGEVNSLTKACINAAADFNGNQQSDLTEYQGTAGIPGPDWLMPFVHFSYFVELYDGWYEPNADPQLAGSYHIREKGRRADEGYGTLLPFYTAHVVDHSQVCHRLRDRDFVEMPTKAKPDIGMDFARYNKPGAVARFGHHSQFKCLQLVNDYSVPSHRQVPYQVKLNTPPKETATNEKDYGEVSAYYDIESCSLAASEKSIAGIKCVTTPESELTLGTVGFGRVKYIHYAESGYYTRGCVNECAEKDTLAQLQTIDPLSCLTTGHYSCFGDTKAFGKFSCGCSDLWKSEDTGCNTECTAWYLDDDDDGYYNPPDKLTGRQCQPPNNTEKWIEDRGDKKVKGMDCLTAANVDKPWQDRDVHPGATEICDRKDNNCDSNVDESFAAVLESCGDDIDNNCNCPCDPTKIKGENETATESKNGCTPEQRAACVDEGFELVGKPCEGKGVCWNKSHWQCAAVDTLPPVCVPDAGARGGLSTRPGNGKDGPTWDWNCDGTVSMVDIGITIDAREQSLYDNSIESQATIMECGHLSVSIYEVPFHDYNAFCHHVGDVPILIGGPEPTQEAINAAQARCIAPHYISLGQSGCGAVYLKINCDLASDGRCRAGGIEQFDNQPCVCGQDVSGTQFFCNNCAFPGDACNCIDESCHNCIGTMCYCLNAPLGSGTPVDAGSGTSQNSNDLPLCEVEHGGPDGDGRVLLYKRELLNKNAIYYTNPIQCE